MTIVLGISENHNSTVCLLQDGKIIYSASEERFSRLKNHSRFPKLALKNAIETTDIEPNDIDLIAFSGYEFPMNVEKYQNEETRLRAKMFAYLAKILPMPLLESDILINSYVKLSEILRKNFRFRKYEKYFSQLGIENPNITLIDHHQTHASTAYFMNNINENKMLIFTCDGEGDGLCATVSIGENGELRRVLKIPLIHSLGTIYSRTTRFLGMKPWEHEYKVMGLAPYADKKLSEESYKIFNKFIRISESDPRKFVNPSKLWGRFFSNYLTRNCGSHRFDAVAYAVQKLTEEILTQWVANCIRHYDIHSIGLAGGVFMNVKANQLILELDSVDKMFIFPSCGDESTAIGAAIEGYRIYCNRDGKIPKIEPLSSLYFGPAYDNILDSFVKEIDTKKYKIERYSDISGVVGEMIAQGKIIARCSSNMEWGARALGNRSILADARDLKIVRTINSMIKTRDFWMPFAPVILSERENDYIINPKKMNAPYMIITFNPTDKVEEIQAAAHQSDLTIRPQIIEKEWNPEYWKILKSFENETGVGGILNTSFNIHGDPIICTPQDALNTVNNSGLEYLTMGDYLISKK